MGCNCKAKNNVDKLIKNVDEINKSSSKDYRGKNKTLKKIIVEILKIIVYTCFFLFLIVGIIPLFIYILLTKNPIKLKIPFKNKLNG